MYEGTGISVALHSLGCKLNQAEQQEMAIAFEQEGFIVVSPREDADVCLINTCTVTAEADRKVRQWLRSVRRRCPGSLVVAAGCGADRTCDGLVPLVDLLVGNRGKKDIVARVAAALQERTSSRTVDVVAVPQYRPYGGRTRSLVKVQEGCATPCAYCIIPLVRGREVSLPTEQIIGNVRGRISNGSREIVLTGTKIGVYQHGDVTLAGLARMLLGLPGLERLRLSSLQPQELSVELLSLWEDDRMCRHFHLSLQSGSDDVLQRMGRGYTVAEYIDAVTRIREVAPGAAVTTDLIAGFPGETDEEFRSTVHLCEEVGFARIHVFPYSRRSGTRAADMPDQVPSAVVKKRCTLLEGIAEASRAAYARSWIDREVTVLWEEETVAGSSVYAGTTDNYLRALCRSRTALQNVLERVTIMRAETEGVWVRRNDEGQG